MNLILVFPPTTEARFFPYLSLPMLTGYLRQQQVEVRQRDLNIELCHRLFSTERLQEYVSVQAEGNQQNLGHLYRMEMAKHLLAHQEEYARSVFEKGSQTGQSRTEAHEMLRFVRQGVELLLEGSILQMQLTSLDAISRTVEQYTDIPPHDLAARELKSLLEQALAAEQPRVFAISISYYSQILPSLLLAKWVKQLRPETFVILGGQQIMLRHEELALLPAVQSYVDALGTGAGEETLLTLWQALTDAGERSKVPNIVWLHEQAADGRLLTGPRSTLQIQEVPPPDFSDLPVTKYLNTDYHLPLVTCFGCFWGRCSFCSYGNRSRRENSYQQKTATQLADEFQHLIEQYGIKRVVLVDENTNLRLVMNAMRKLNQRGFSLQFSTRNRLEPLLLDKEFVREFRERGCVVMSVGYETNSQRLLDMMDKGVNAADYQTIIDNLHEVGITLRVSVMGGFPTETPEEVAASEAFLQRNADKIGIDVMQMLVAEPKTYLVEKSEQHHIRLDESWQELRGNKMLSYGMGRMGNDFAYLDGSTFQERLEGFLSIYRNVQPQNNVDLPPGQRKKKQEEPEQAGPLFEVELLPWVKVVQASVKPGSPAQPVVIDLLWQRFYALPQGVHQHGYTLRVEDQDIANGGEVLRSFVQNGLAQVKSKAQKGVTR